MAFLEVKFSDEQPPEREIVFIVDKKGNKYAGSRHGKYLDTRNVRNDVQPIEWFDCWLKEI